MTLAPFKQIPNAYDNGTALREFIDGHLAQYGHAIEVEVQKVHDKDGNDYTDDDKVGFVDVKPLIKQITIDGKTIKHTTIYNIPFVRFQGGPNAFLNNPQKGDMGLYINIGRDHSHILSNRKESSPASFSIFDWAHGVYIPALLNKKPKNYVKFDKDGNIILHTEKKLIVDQCSEADITVKDKDGNKGKCKIDASEIDATCDIKTDGNVVARKDVKAGDISLKGHVHGNGHDGGNTTPPKD